MIGLFPHLSFMPAVPGPGRPAVRTRLGAARLRAAFLSLFAPAWFPPVTRSADQGAVVVDEHASGDCFPISLLTQPADQRASDWPSADCWPAPVVSSEFLRFHTEQVSGAVGEPSPGKTSALTASSSPGSLAVARIADARGHR